VQNALLAEQTILIDPGTNVCPNCREKLKKNGQSRFYAVFSDHKLPVQKHRCSSPECGWQSSSTLPSLFGTNIHPDKREIVWARCFVYREAEQNLESWIVNGGVWIIILKSNGLRIKWGLCLPNSYSNGSTGICRCCGANYPSWWRSYSNSRRKTQFWSLVSHCVSTWKSSCRDQHHRQINKTCVVSARDDNLQTIKIYLINAALKQGMSPETKVTGLADGANNGLSYPS